MFYKLLSNKIPLKFTYFKNYSIIIFALAFILMALAYNFDDILFMRPQSVHQWRQCDCLSFALNYYQEDISFFEPQLNYLAGDGTGKTVSDCPLIYYSVAQLWKVFGYHEFIYRLMVLTICFLGLLSLMKTIEGILKDSFMALIISLLMYTSTILVYYSNNFMMNVPSFSFALIGIYYFYHFFKTEKTKYLFFSMVMYLLGGLLKIPALTSFMAIIGLYFLELFGFVKLKKDHKLFSKPIIHFLPFAIIGIVIFLWYYYAYQYNKNNNAGIFLIGILPIWEVAKERIIGIYKHVWVALFDSYHSPFIQYLSVFMLLMIFVFRKKQNTILFFSTSFLFIGFVLFIILWYDVFDFHDYYLINQLIFMISIFVTFFWFIKNHYKKLYLNVVFRLVLIVILAVHINFCRNNIRYRYFGELNHAHVTGTKSLEKIDPYLDSIGIDKSQKVLFMNDGSFNIALYLMNRKGYTAYYGTSEEAFQERIKRVDYLMINDTSLLSRDYIKEPINKKIGNYKNIHIFSLSPK